MHDGGPSSNHRANPNTILNDCTGCSRSKSDGQDGCTERTQRSIMTILTARFATQAADMGLGRTPRTKPRTAGDGCPVPMFRPTGFTERTRWGYVAIIPGDLYFSPMVLGLAACLALPYSVKRRVVISEPCRRCVSERRRRQDRPSNERGRLAPVGCDDGEYQVA